MSLFLSRVVVTDLSPSASFLVMMRRLDALELAKGARARNDAVSSGGAAARWQRRLPLPRTARRQPSALEDPVTRRASRMRHTYDVEQSRGTALIWISSYENSPRPCL